MPFNIYQTKTMLAAVNQMFPVRTFLRDTFFPVKNDDTFPTEEILIDYKKGKRKMAPFVAPRVGGVTMDRQGYKTERYKAPKIAPQRVLTIDDISIRGLGEDVFSTRTSEERQQELLGTDLAELDEMITRREEWMCRELLFNGKVIMKGFIDIQSKQYIEDELNYGFTNKVVLTEGDKWDTATSKKYDNLKSWRLEVIKKTGKAPNIVIMSQDVLALYIEDEVIQKKMDIRNMFFGNINPIIVNDSVTYIGRLTELGLDIYTYDEWFIDDNEKEQPMVPLKHLLMGSKDMGKFKYGAITQLENNSFITYEGKRVPKQWADQANDQKMLRISSRPVPIPYDIDTWYVAQVY
ncbi:major capsid protein [Tissierella praeacuta]|uniref:major capsid protein n=1 Tax=Tissierella praeacuta TaxID=43131 RepID=UPI0028A59A77|nr:major capsid protein [Tissierella praeacuta]